MLRVGVGHVGDSISAPCGASPARHGQLSVADLYVTRITPSWSVRVRPMSTRSFETAAAEGHGDGLEPQDRLWGTESWPQPSAARDDVPFLNDSAGGAGHARSETATRHGVLDDDVSPLRRISVLTRSFAAVTPGVVVRSEQVAQPGLFDRRVASAHTQLLVDGSSVGLQCVDRDEEGGRDLGL